MARSEGTSERSTSVQLPFLAWLSTSERSAPPQPTRSSAMACLRVRGSVDTWLTANAQPVPRPHTGLPVRARVRRRAEGRRDRRG
eukprot:4485467-Pleurochrysis_carterae.AAC.1